MALDTQVKDQATKQAPAAGPKKPVEGFSVSRKIGVGLNVAVSVLAAAALLVLVNWMAHQWFVRRDVSRLKRYSMSDHLAKVLDRSAGPIHIDIVYDSEKPDKERARYQPPVLDLVREMQMHNPRLTYADVASPAAMIAFNRRIEKFRGASGTEHRRLIEAFIARAPHLEQTILAEKARIEQVNAADTWLGQFTQVSNAATNLAASAQLLSRQSESVRDLGKAARVRYDEQVKAIGEFVTPALEHLQKSAEDVAELAKLAAAMSDPASADLLKRTDERARAISARFQAVAAELGGGPSTRPAADRTPPKVLTRVAAELAAVAAELKSQGEQMSKFAEKCPAVIGAKPWQIAIAPGLMGRADKIMTQLAAGINQMAAEIRTLTTQFQPDALKEYYPDMVRKTGEIHGFVVKSLTDVSALLSTLKRIDQPSRRMLDEGDRYLADLLTQLRALKTGQGDVKGLDKLAELKGADLPEKLESDNLVVIQVGDGEPRVLTFDEVWPLVKLPDIPTDKDRKAPPARTFNGDSAFASALLSMTHQPLAEVVFVHYSQPSPYGYGGGNEGQLPYSELSALRDRLTKANCKVAEWNLAAGIQPPPPAYAGDDDAAASTQPDDRPALPRVYVVLPPPGPTPPNPYQPQPTPGFGDEHVNAFKKAMDKDGRAVFLASYLWRQREGFSLRTTPYGWDSYLSADWGIDVLTDYRLVQGIPDAELDRYKISLPGLIYMPLSNFSESSPVGKPLRNRRVLLNDACPVSLASQTPDNVSYQTLLSVPDGDRATWATRAITDLWLSVQAGEPNVTPDRNPIDGDKFAPIDVMIAAEARPPDGPAKQLIVFAAASSLADSYLTARVPRFGDEGTIVTDPPPDANPEIIVNSVYHLVGRDDYIAAGPVAVPPIQVSPSRLRIIHNAVIWALPLLVLVVGGVVFYVRRKP